MITNLVLVSFNTHRVHMSRDEDTGRIICFKYDGSACDFQSFDQHEDAEAALWITEPLPSIMYRVVTTDE